MFHLTIYRRHSLPTALGWLAGIEAARSLAWAHVRTGGCWAVITSDNGKFREEIR